MHNLNALNTLFSPRFIDLLGDDFHANSLITFDIYAQLESANYINQILCKTNFSTAVPPAGTL